MITEDLLACLDVASISMPHHPNIATKSSGSVFRVGVMVSDRGMRRLWVEWWGMGVMG